MNYPLISEYIEAIKSAEDNFEELSYLRPVLGDDGLPVMTSGNFAVVFKMKDEATGIFYALKCFTKEQEGRAEAYQQITEELRDIDSPYLTSVRYLDKELFVDTEQTDETEFPVLLMDWVEGKTLDKYLRENLEDKYALEMLAYRFSQLAQWLIPQSFAHGDLKPDNILVRENGTLVLVDYDGMYVPAMKGQKARELGSPDFRHPSRTENDFDEHIDDFPLVSILLSLKAVSLQSNFLEQYGASDRLLFSEKDYRNTSKCGLLKELFLSSDTELNILVSLFILSIGKSNLSDVSSTLLNLTSPQRHVIENLSTKVTKEDLATAWTDEYGVKYSSDKKRLLSASTELTDYSIRPGTCVVCDCAFQQKVLISIHIPDSVRTIGKGAFFGCGFTSIHIPDSVTSIGVSAFMGCGITSIHIPDSVTSIGESAFSYCGALKYIRIPNSLTSIENRVFMECRTLSSIQIPNNITSIGDYAFSECESLTSIHMTDSVTTIGLSAFKECTSLNSINISNSVTSIENSVFSGCTSLTSIRIPDSITTIGHSAFKECTALASINIPNSVISIGNSAFKECTALTSINIPDEITRIGDETFEFCNNLSFIGIPDNVTIIGKGAFCGCRSLTSIHIPDSVTRIGESAFLDCSSITSIHIPDSVIIIEDGTFSGCRSLTSIHIPDSITRIGESAFVGCSSITSINLPDSVISIGDDAFSECEALTSIHISDSVINIGSGAFSGCESIISFKIPKNVVNIGYYTFSCCKALTSVYIPNSVTIIDNSVFWGCVSLTSIHIVDGTRKKFEELLPEYKDILVEDL